MKRDRMKSEFLNLTQIAIGLLVSALAVGCTTTDKQDEDGTEFELHQEDIDMAPADGRLTWEGPDADNPYSKQFELQGVLFSKILH